MDSTTHDALQRTIEEYVRDGWSGTIEIQIEDGRVIRMSELTEVRPNDERRFAE